MEHGIALAPEPSTAAKARRAAETALEDWGLARWPGAHDVRVVVSELATNAVLHAGTTLVVRLSCGSGCVRIEVADKSPAPPRVPTGDGRRPSGRGLMIVEALSARWGCEPRRDGKVVWAEVPLAG